MKASKTPLEVVSLQAPILVKPLEAAPTTQSHATTYFLSNIDLAVAHITVGMFLVFEAAAQHISAHKMKEALEKVLVHYYPIAGRLGHLSPQQRRPFVDCNGAGVGFVVADANIEISELGDLALPDPATVGQLLFPIPVVEDPPLLTAKVTKFKCGGFVLGVAFKHCMLDGAAAGEFLKAWGETMRGVPLSIMPPFLDRSILQPRSPLQIEHQHSEYENPAAEKSSRVDARFVESFCFSLASLEKLKKEALYLEDDEDVQVLKCTTFEALAAQLWKARTRVLALEAAEEVKMVVVVDARGAGMVQGSRLPKGYVGNGLLLTDAVATAGELEEQALARAVMHVQSAKARARLPGYMQSQIDYMHSAQTRGATNFGSSWCTFVISSWCTLPFYDTNFGSGTPKHVAPDPSPLLCAGARHTAILVRHRQAGINALMSFPDEAAAQNMKELLRQYLL